MKKLRLAMAVLALLLLPACTTESPESNDDQISNVEQETSTTVPTEPETDGTETEATKTEETEIEEKEPEAIEPEELSLAIGDSGTLGDWEITLDSFEVTDSIPNTYGSFKPDEGNKYVAVSLTIKNNGKSADTFLPSFSFGNTDVIAKILYKGEYEFSATNLLGYSDGLHDSTLNPLSSKSGVIAFSVADEAAESPELTLILSLGKETLEYSLN